MFADELKKARIAIGISGREAAKRLGISSPYYSQLETGKRDMPKGILLEKIEDLMRCKFAGKEPERLQNEQACERLQGCELASEVRNELASVAARLDRLEKILLDVLARLPPRA